MFENFPYTDMHQLNLDWIIKIAKDFLEQYTHIQDTISQGLEDLDSKAENLQNLLQEWYDTHSQDIANQLADALQDLNDWYSEHQGYLDSYLTNSIAAFNTAADTKAAQTLASIPEDYTALDSLVKQIHDGVNRKIHHFIDANFYPGVINQDGSIGSGSTYYASDIIIDGYEYVYFQATTTTGYFAFYDASGNLTGSFALADFAPGTYHYKKIPENTHIIKCTVSAYAGTTHARLFYGTYAINYLINNIAKGNNRIRIESNFFPGLIDSNGSVQSSSTTYYMDFSLVDDYKYVEYDISTTNGYYAFYNQDKGLLTSAPLSSYTIGEKVILEVPETAVYFRITCSIYAGINQQRAYGKFTYISREEFMNTPKKYRVEKDGSGDYTNLANAINEAIKHKDSIVYVGPGTWDIIADLGNYMGSVDYQHRGLYLQNGIHVICSSKALIVANYTGNNANIHTWFSVFNAGPGGFTLENAIIEAKNIRYIIHDERDYTDPNFYHNKYINCRMIFDNSLNPDWNDMQCIGGGLGINGYIEIDGCYFESKPTQETAPLIVVGYHNSQDLNNLNAQSTVEMKNCFIAGSRTTFRMVGMGNSTKKSYGYVSGSRFGYAPHAAGTDNVVVTAWNNTIVQN